MSKSSNPAVRAKVSAMFGKRLKEEDYNELLSCQSLESITLYLKGHPAFSSVLTEVDAAYVHRGYLEAVIQREYFRDFLKLFHYLGRNDRSFLKIIILSYEIDEILWCINSIHDPALPNVGFLNYKYDYLDQYSKVDFFKLSQADTPLALLAALEDTPFADVLRPLYETEGDLPYSGAEHFLWAYYYKMFYEHIKKFFGKKKAPELEKSVGVEVDTLNLMLIYRLRQRFRLPGETVRAYLFDKSYKLKPEMIDALIKAETKEGFENALRATPYRALTEGDLQRNIAAMIDHNARKTIHFSTQSVALILAFLTLKDTELQNIKTIVEGCRYNMPREQIEPLLIHYRKARESR